MTLAQLDVIAGRDDEEGEARRRLERELHAYPRSPLAAGTAG
jgi:hypothetical protein